VFLQDWKFNTVPEKSATILIHTAFTEEHSGYQARLVLPYVKRSDSAANINRPLNHRCKKG